MNAIGKILLLSIVTVAFFSSCKESNQKILDQIAIEANKQCPKAMDDFTIMDSIVSKPGNQLHYYYTIAVDSIPEDIDKNTYTLEAKQLILNNLKNNVAIKPLITRNIIFVHRYNDKRGNLFIQVNITPEDYK